MGRTLDRKTEGMPKLRLIKEDETLAPQDTTPPQPQMKSAIAKELNSFADELDKQIALLLAM